MILRLVFSFFFLSVVTGNPQLDVKPAESAVPKARTGTGLSSKEDCSCEDQDHNNLVQTSTQVVSSTTVSQPPELRLKERYFQPSLDTVMSKIPWYPTPQTTKPKNYPIVLVSDGNVQVPNPQQYAADEMQIAEKTVCITPSMIQKIVKAALEYVTQMPSELNNIVDQIDREINKMSVIQSKQESIVRQSAQPYTETVYQKPRSQARTNLLLNYDLPGEQGPNCIEALEKLIEITYKAYLELEHQPQCQESLYKFASTYREDRPGGYLENGQPGMKSLIVTILEEIQKQRPITTTYPSESDRYGGYEVPKQNIYPSYTPPVNQIIEHTLSPSSDQLPHTQTLEIKEYTYPKPQTITFPSTPQVNQVIEHTISPVPAQLPHTQTLQIKEYTYPPPQTITFPSSPPVYQVFQHTISPMPHRIPKTQTLEIKEYTYPQPQRITYPSPPPPLRPAYQVLEQITISPVPNRLPKTQKLLINENTYPRPQMVTLPTQPPIQQDTIMQHTVRPIKHVPIKPIQPEGVMNLIKKLLQTSDKPNNGKVYDHIIKLVDLNPNIFHPQLLKQITTILKTHKQSNVPRIKELLLHLINVQQQPQPKDVCTESLVTYLQPNNLGQYDARLVDVLLYLVNKRPSLSECEYISSLLNPFTTGLPQTGDYAEITFNVIRQLQNQLLTPEQTNIITTLLTPYLPDLDSHSNEPAVITAKELSKWNGMGVSPEQFNLILNILKPAYPNTSVDQRAIDTVYFLLINGHRLVPQSIEFILTLLSPQNGIIDTRRLDLINIIFNELQRSPKHGLLLLSLLIENGPNILNSKYVEILILLKRHNVITIELLDVLVKLLNDEINGQLDINKIQTLIYHITPYKQTHPTLVNDILTLLNLGGLSGNNLQLPQPQPQEQEYAQPPNVIIENSETGIPPPVDFTNEYRTPDGGYQTIEESNIITPIYPSNPNPEDDLVQIFKWLESHGLLNPDQTSNNELVNKILKILQLGERELGVLELTYMLKHAKPLIYQPVYYVKYRLPILSFIANMKSLLVENPNLNADPMKLLQELIVVSNVTEVSPNLQGFPKEEIMKLTLYDGDLIQAKILDEQNMNLNEQIAYVHTLNSEISPEELLHLNEMNEAKFFPNLIQMNDGNKLTILGNTVDKFVEFPPVQYQQVITTSNPGLTHETHTVHQTYIERTNQQTTPQTVPQTLVLPIK